MPQFFVFLLAFQFFKNDSKWLFDHAYPNQIIYVNFSLDIWVTALVSTRNQEKVEMSKLSVKALMKQGLSRHVSGYCVGISFTAGHLLDLPCKKKQILPIKSMILDH